MGYGGRRVGLPVTDLAVLSVEQRLAQLEQRLGIAAPLAVVPPITVGSLTNVPVPGSQIAAQWAQDVSALAVHKFTTTALLKAWAAPQGAWAVALDTGVLWRRAGGGWAQFTPWSASVAGNALNGVQSAVISTLQIPADPGLRVANISTCLQIDVFHDRTATLGLTAAGTEVAQAVIPRTLQLDPGSTMTRWNISLAAKVALAVNTVAQVTLSIVIAPTPGLGTYQTYAGLSRNRLDALVVPVSA